MYICTMKKTLIKPELKLNKTITLKGGSKWEIIKIFDPSTIKDRTYQMLRATFGGNGLEYTLRDEHSEILMSEKRLLENLIIN